MRNINCTRGLLWTLSLALALAMHAPAQAGTIVRFDTVVGTFDVELYDSVTPLTVANFLNYVQDGDYDSSFIHRNAWTSLPTPQPFVIQGGGYTVGPDSGGTGFLIDSVPTDPPVLNEFQISNTEGTIAMAKLGGDPDSATSQFFFNMSDNSANLDGQNGGFTVFGHVLGGGMSVLQYISTLGPFGFASPFDDIPLRDYTQADYDNYAEVELDNFVIINSVAVVPEPATLSLLGLGCLTILRRRRRR